MRVGMKWDLVGVVVATGSAIAGFGIVILRVDPFQASLSILSLFYLTFFMSAWGLITLISYVIKRFISKNYIHEKIFESSFWQGLFISLVLVVILIVMKWI